MKRSEKLILSGTDNNGIKHRYSFEKNKSFRREFIQLMESLGFNKEKIKQKFVTRSFDDTKDGEVEIITNLSAKDLIDLYWSFQNNEYEIDVIFGSQKVILLIRTNQKTKRDRRRKMLNELEKKSDWISEKEKEKRMKKNKKIGETIVKPEIIISKNKK